MLPTPRTTHSRLTVQSGASLGRAAWVKPGVTNPYVIVDAAMNDLARPALYDAWHDFDAVTPTGERMTANIAGPVCESGDTFAMGREIDAVKSGDAGEIVRIGLHEETSRPVYLVEFAPSRVIGCLEDEIAPL